MSEHIHRSTIRVLYGDTDAGGVVYNANYLRYFEYGRTELMRDWVCAYSEIEQMGFILPVTECWTRYKAPALYDDLLAIETEIRELTRLKCAFNYRIYREEENSKRKLLAKGYTVHVAVDKAGKLTRLPQEIIAKISPFVSGTQDGNDSSL